MGLGLGLGFLSLDWSFLWDCCQVNREEVELFTGDGRMQQTETAPSIFTAKGLLFQVAGVCPGEPSAQEQASYKYQHFSWYKIKKEHIIIHNLQVRL